MASTQLFTLCAALSRVLLNAGLLSRATAGTCHHHGNTDHVLYGAAQPLPPCWASGQIQRASSAVTGDWEAASLAGLPHLSPDTRVKENDGKYRKIYTSAYLKIGNVDQVLCTDVMTSAFPVSSFRLLE